MRLTLRQHLAEQRRAYLRAVLEQAGGNVSEAAKLAGVNRTYMHRLLVGSAIKAGQKRWACRGNRAWKSLEH